MGSSKPPEGPFGFIFDTSTSNYPFPSPTAPAPGPSLLDDNESKFLDSFFDGVSSDHFNFDFFNNAPDGSELGLGWEELPPAFMGTSSSFGQQPQVERQGMLGPGLNFGDALPQMNTEHLIRPTATADVLAAATLLQNGSNGRSHSMADETLYRGNTQIQHNDGLSRAQSMSQSTTQLPLGLQPMNGDDYMRDTFYTDAVFGSHQGALRHNKVADSQKVDIQWGSDITFGTAQVFVPPAGQEALSAKEQYHRKGIEAAFNIRPAQLPDSADNTRPSSPVVTKDSASHQRSNSLPQNNSEEDNDSRPNKRRKTKFPEEEEDDDDFQAATSRLNIQTNKKRKGVKKESSDAQAGDSEAGLKRRKSSAGGAAAKATRENLTEEQKRENHIKSEQKRRTLIREGFEDLSELVPGLRGGGFSKSAVLTMAADWLEDLLQGNRVLQARLDMMEGRT